METVPLDHRPTRPTETQAAIIMACLEEALDRLVPIAPGGSRTRIGRAIMDARNELLNWVE